LATAEATGVSHELLAKRVRTTFLDLCTLVNATVAVEIGAFEAGFSLWVSKNLPGTRVVAFEANPYVHERFREEVTAAGVEYVNSCVGPQNGPVTLHIPRDFRGGPRDLVNQMASLQANLHTEQHQALEVEGVRLDDFMELSENDRLIAWIDTEGALEAVLSGSRDVLSRASVVFVEVENVPMWDGQWLDNEVVAWFRGIGKMPILRDIQRPQQYNLIFISTELAANSSVGRRAACVYTPPATARPVGDEPRVGPPPKVSPIGRVQGLLQRVLGRQNELLRQQNRQPSGTARHSDGITGSGAVRVLPWWLQGGLPLPCAVGVGPVQVSEREEESHVEIVVTGFHRSGTSMVTELLHRAGLFVGDELIDDVRSNQYGHFEDREVFRIHRDILGDNGVDWMLASTLPLHISEERWDEMTTFVAKRQAQHENWGFKDPRSCLFLGAWKYLMPDSRYVIVYRDPADCVRSLERRQAGEYFDERGNAQSHLRFFRQPNHGVKMWDVCNRYVIAFARAHLDDCLVLPFERVAAGYPLMHAVNARFGSLLEEIPNEAVFDPTIVARSSSIPVYGAHARARVAETWSSLAGLSKLTEAHP
jgi:FkbM family methyltransferase